MAAGKTGILILRLMGWSDAGETESQVHRWMKPCPRRIRGEQTGRKEETQEGETGKQKTWRILKPNCLASGIAVFSFLKNCSSKLLHARHWLCRVIRTQISGRLVSYDQSKWGLVNPNPLYTALGKMLSRAAPTNHEWKTFDDEWSNIMLPYRNYFGVMKRHLENQF